MRFFYRSLRAEAGQAGTALVIVIAWALTAVVMLTVTLVSAQQIDDRVKDITGSVTGIKGETALVSILTETNQTVKGILEAAKPLAPKLEEVDGHVKSIDSSVKSILATARSIGSTVDSIHSQAGAILGVVREIYGKPGGGADGLGVADINERAGIALPIVQAIKGDTASIKDDVVRGTGTGGIHFHACKALGLG
ncbi:MAG: hypothetical protein ACRD0D_00565, partial [Acidimicrobiales bacterium]